MAIKYLIILNILKISTWGSYRFPQIYYLDIDGVDGYYITETLTLSNKHIPFTISSIMNKKLRSRIPGDELVWNISLNYLFNKQLKRI